MPRVQLTHLCAGLLVSAVGLALVLSSPANAEGVHKKQGLYHSQRAAANANARRVLQGRVLGMLHQDGC